MKIYKFQLVVWRNHKINVTECDAVETPKTYTVKSVDRGWEGRINKSDIGVISGYDNHTVYLFENDLSKAVSILLEEQKRKLKILKQHYAAELKETSKKINTLEEIINK